MSTSKWPNWLRGLLVVVVCATFAAGAWAQSMTAGGITGTVVDQTGAAVPNAAITIRNVDTNSQQPTSSDAEGRFRVAGLTPGTYAVEAKATNFAPYKADAIVVQIGAVTTLEIRLGIAGKAETVEVTGDMAMVNTVQADFASNINQGQIENLPINGRRWSNFALLAPGAGMDGTYGLISFRGMTGLMNNSTIDGGDNNQAFMSEERGRTRASYVVSQASVREFQVNTSNYSAEYGRAAGAVVNTVTKSGGNNLHGMAFYNIRDNTLGAYNPLTTRTLKDASTGQYVTTPYKPEDRRQQFGGNLGGPLVKDKLFFFFNYDGQRWNMPGIASPRSANQVKQLLDPGSSSEIKTLAQRMYNLCNTASPPVCSNPNAAQTAAATTAFDAGRQFLQQVTGVQPRNNPQDIFFPRLDWRITQNNTFFASYNRMRRTATAMVQSPAVVNRGVGDWGDDLVKVDVVNARLSSAISSTLSNELRFSWGRDFESQRSTPQQNPVEQAVAALATVPSYGGYLPQTYIASNMYVGRPYYTERYAYPDEHRFQVADTAAWAHGKHLIKFGVDVSRVNDLMSFVNQAGGAYSYSSRTDFISDFARITSPSTWHGAASSNGYYSSLNQGVGPRDFEFNTWDYAFFVQDDFRVHPRLTLNLGLRYEYEQLPEPQIPNPAFPLTQKMPSDKNNIAPRIGFAFDMFGDTKTVLRGGYGIYYSRIANSTIESALGGTGLTDSAGRPLGQVNYYFTPSMTGAPRWPNVFGGAVASTAPDIVMFGPGVQAPHIHQADLIFEHEIARNTVFSVSYLLSLGRHLVNVLDSNLAESYTPVTYNFSGGPFNGESTVAQIFSKVGGQTRPNPAFARIEQFRTDVNSNYNALVAQVNRRMTNGLQFQFSYTWSKALDWGQESFTFTDNNSNKSYDIFNPQYDYGTSNYDVRHRFIANVVWQPQHFKSSGPIAKALLNNWTISPIFAFTSGRPYTEYMNGAPTMPAGTSYAIYSFNGSGGPSRLAPLLGRNAWRMPWLENIDLRLGRTIRLSERHSVDLLAEAFNLFNHKNVFYMNNTLYRMCSSSTTPRCTTAIGAPVPAGQVAPNTWIYDNTFGTVSGADSNLYRERQVQFGVRYTF